jgi:mRNA-degrading endonuclease RelE of RelBE toxin-antitoxin system
MQLVFSDSAKKELENLPEELIDKFLKHLEKMQEMPPRKHMKYVVPCHVEKVTRQARIIYAIKRTRSTSCIASRATKSMSAGINRTSDLQPAQLLCPASTLP